jgi:hypothetical protein
VFLKTDAISVYNTWFVGKVNMEHQLDATITVLVISKISSTCFGQTFAHLQERVAWHYVDGQKFARKLVELILEITKTVIVASSWSSIFTLPTLQMFISALILRHLTQ